MSKRYTRAELQSLIMIEEMYGQITYQNPSLIEELFLKETGVFRSSGCLYMAMWRIKNGFYDHILYDDDPFPPTPSSSSSYSQLDLL